MKTYRLKDTYDKHLQENNSALYFLTSLSADKVTIEWQYERERGTSATISIVTAKFHDPVSEMMFLLRFSELVDQIQS
jgi:hypothetical protein